MPVKKVIPPVKIPEILPVKPYFQPVKKIAKVGVKKKVAVKNHKKVEKSGRENRFLPVKKTAKSAKNVFHAHF